MLLNEYYRMFKILNLLYKNPHDLFFEVAYEDKKKAKEKFGITQVKLLFKDLNENIAEIMIKDKEHTYVLQCKLSTYEYEDDFSIKGIYYKTKVDFVIKGVRNNVNASKKSNTRRS